MKDKKATRTLPLAVVNEGHDRFLGGKTLQSGLDKDQQEEDGDAVYQGMNFARLAAGELYKDVGDKPEPYAVGDVER